MHNYAEDNLELQEKLLELQKRNAELELSISKKQEDIETERFHTVSGIRFVKSLKTGMDWMATCPKCKMPATDIGVVGYDGAPHTITCSAGCGWQVELEGGLSGVMVDVKQW